MAEIGCNNPAFDVPRVDSLSPGQEMIPGRQAILGAIRLELVQRPKPNGTFLIVINIADVKNYDDFIRIFGYRFADDLLNVRATDIRAAHGNNAIYHIGFWSVGLIFHAGKTEPLEVFLNKLAVCLEIPMICRGIPVPIKAGIGVCDIAKGMGAAEDLLQSAFLAGQMSVKSVNRWRVCDYAPESDHRRAFSLIAEAGYALAATNDFELSFQPRIHMRSNQFVAAEALLRWRHPSLGIIAPDEFVPLLEMTGLIQPLTEWVLSKALASAVRWHRAGFKLKICVNISVRNLEEQDFVERLRDLLKYSGLPPKFLELEFSEATPFFDFNKARQILNELRELEIGIAVDDFGTGNNSFTYLQTTPASIMKIDESLIHTLTDNLRSPAVVKSIIAMAHETDMAVVAEGIETADVFALLKSWSCDYAQGYVICSPVKGDDFLGWCAANLDMVKRAALPY